MKSLKRLYIVLVGLIVLANTACGIVHLWFKNYAAAFTWLVVVNHWVIQYYRLDYKHTEDKREQSIECRLPRRVCHVQ